jgi:glycine cleavage system H protein
MSNEYYELLADKFLFLVKKGLLYDERGVWVQTDRDLVRIGVTDYFQRTNGDVTFVEPPQIGTQVTRTDELFQMETIKAVISIHSPMEGMIVKINASLYDNPEAINEDPYGKGWLVLISPSNRDMDLTKLLTAQRYFELMQSKIAIISLNRGVKND